MSTQAVEPRHWLPIDAVSRWWRDWTNGRTVSSEFGCCAEPEVDRIARDMGMSASELRELTRRGPEASDLLLRRMAALNLDRNEVSRAAPGTLQDMQRVCALCEHHKHCAKELARDPSNPAWEHYCPNVDTLKSLNALPWATRNDW